MPSFGPAMDNKTPGVSKSIGASNASSIGNDELNHSNELPNAGSQDVMEPKAHKKGDVAKKVNQLELASKSNWNRVAGGHTTSSTPTTATLSTSMPMTTVLTSITTMATVMSTGACSDMTLSVIATTSSTTMMTTPLVSELADRDGKRKNADRQRGEKAVKRRNIDKLKQADKNSEKIKANEDAEEDISIKAMFCDIKSTMTFMSKQMEKIQQENSEWRGRVEKLENECTGLKDSVNMVHGLVKDESSQRQKMDKGDTEEP